MTRRWYQFSLSSLFLAVLATAVFALLWCAGLELPAAMVFGAILGFALQLDYGIRRALIGAVVGMVVGGALAVIGAFVWMSLGLPGFEFPPQN